MIQRGISVLVLGGLLAGCAMHGTDRSQLVSVTSTPPGAVVSIDGTRQADTTPLTVALDPSRTHEVSVDKPCYVSTPVTLRPEMAKRPLFLTVYDLVNQLPPAVHIDLTPTCGTDGRRLP